MESELVVIASMNPVPDSEARDWAESPSGVGAFRRAVDLGESEQVQPVESTPGRRWLLALAVLAVMLFIAFPTLIQDNRSTLSPSTSLPPTLDLFEVGLPWALIIDDGLSGATAVDLNGGRIAAADLVGQRPGDQPYRLEMVRDHLVVGWSEIYGIDLVSSQSTLLGEATYYVPAAAPDRVWLIDYSGGRVGSGTLLAQQVSIFGSPLGEPVSIDSDGIPAIGIPNGLALESDRGVVLLDTARGTEIDRLGTLPAVVSDVTTGPTFRLAWCELTCGELHVTDLVSGEDRIVDFNPDGFDGRGAQFSEDGRFLAVPTSRSEIILIDLNDGTSELITAVRGERISLEFAPQGSELFVLSSPTIERRAVDITHYNPATGDLQKTTISLDPLGLSFVVVDRSLIQGLFPAS